MSVVAQLPLAYGNVDCKDGPRRANVEDHDGDAPKPMAARHEQVKDTEGASCTADKRRNPSLLSSSPETTSPEALTLHSRDRKSVV